MLEADIETAEGEEADTEVKTEAQTQDIEAGDATDDSTPAEGKTTTLPGKANGKESASYVPFAEGRKEKVTIKGVEREMDFETMRRYASIGAGDRANSREAHQIREKANDTMGQMIQMAVTEPDALIQMLSGLAGKRPKGALTKLPAARARGQEATEDTEGQETDPRLQEIQELRERLDRYERRDQDREVSEERKAVESELDAEAKKYPELQKPWVRAYVKNQYKQQLLHARNLNDVTMSDVAFLVVQEMREDEAGSQREKQKRLEEKRRKAPAGFVPGGGAGDSGDEPEDKFAAVRKLAGIQ